MKKIVALLLAALLAATPALAETTYFGTMMVDNCEEWVSLRDGPGTGCNRLAKVPLHAIVTDAERAPITGDFIYCNYDGQWGYILARYLVPWADPEPELNARFDSALGFSFGYDDSRMIVDADGSEDGQSLALYTKDLVEPVYLELLTEKSVGMSPSEFLAQNAPADAAFEADTTAGGAPVRWFRTSDADNPAVVRVFYAVEGAETGLVAIGTCQLASAEEWIAQFNAVVLSIAFDGDAPLRADWAEATRNALVVDADGEYVTIMADAPVTDVALLGLELSDTDAVFDAKVLYTRDTLTPDDPLVVRIAFPGDIPSYGIRCTDGEGRLWQYAIGMSGEDGSLVLVPFGGE